ncbi:MAG: sodium:proton antiporter [Alphaproteobacteria bacterium]|nr:MAG: sodium:proton antiporter [Alphaproteobacteria bacterium]
MDHASDPTLILTLLLAAGIGAQLISDHFKLPAILPLLLIGFLVGPVFGIFDPDRLFGDLLFPGVSLGVAVILFEGALTLRFADLAGAERVVLRLVTLGVAVSIAVIAVVTHHALGLSWSLSLLFGAIASVSGPTVVIPLLRAVRPSERVSQILRWEGILIDPIGAVLAVIIFEAIVAGAGQGTDPVTSLLGLLVSGSMIGIAAGYGLGVSLQRHWIPDFLRNVTTLSAVLLTFSLANLMASEAGLVAVTAMGLTLANLRAVPRDEILDFKESLSVLLISLLFIVLAARIDLAALAGIGPALLFILAAILFLARPLATLAATLGTDLPWRERALLSWIAPRGIVAAAVSALFALRLKADGVAGAELLVPLTFSVIVATVVLHSLTGRPLARLLKVAEPEPRGVLIVGGNPVALAIAERLQGAAVPVLVADTSYDQIRRARMKGIPTFFGNAVSEYADRKLDLIGLGMLLAMSRRPSLNALACLRYRPEFGSARVFTIRREESMLDRELETVSFGFRGRLLFKPEMTLERLEKELASGKTIRLVTLSEDFGFDDLLAETGGTAALLFAIAPDGHVRPFAEDSSFRVGPKWRIGYLAESAEPKSSRSASE